MADAKTEKQKVQEITEKLEQGIKELFESEKYKTYLNTMSKFHNYSFNNTMLIAMQKPDATLVAGFKAWQKNFDRHVKKGEKGIRILAPAPYKIKEEQEKLDPVTGEIMLDKNGMPITEEVEIKIPAFRVVPVFDVSQTDGKELPDIGVNELSGSVEDYEDFMQALTEVSPVPITYEDIDGDAKGYFHTTDHRIAIQEGMSQSQTVKTAIHEVAHAKLHDRERNQDIDAPYPRTRIGRIIRDIQLSEENLKKCRYERLSEIFPRIMFYSYATVKTTKETGGFNMNQQTNENNSTSCSYQELNPEMDAFLQGYLEEGRRKGLQESTIHLHDKIGHYFLFAMTETGCLKPQEMNAQNVGIACLKISSRWYLSHIRTFLRYAYQSGNTDRDYSGIVPLFKIPQPYPSVYTAEEIQKIENSVDQSSPHGKRDYAALLLATRLGIRSGDISSMTLECLDFERNLIRLTQHKTGVFIEFPMVSDVKVALERYLQEERTAYDSPYVFLRIVPPYGHISVQAITKIARTAIAVAGIEPGGRKQGAHAFRSSLASSMINDNIPYEAVRKILGHTDQNAIRSYARLDMEQLRGYALPVMEATGIFAEFLEGRWSLS